MADNITPLIQEYIIDFASNNNFFFVKGVQGDGYGVRYVQLSLSNNGQPYIINEDNVRAVIIGTKPDNKEICNECEIIDSSTIRFELTQQMLAVAGKGNYSIAIMSTKSNQTLKSFPFYIFTNQTSFDVENITSSDEFGLLIEKINKADGLTEDVTAAIENVEQATNNCINATNEVSRKTARCEQAISECNTATSNANLATNKANESANNCNTATDNANLATTNANKAAQSANDAAERCNQIADGTGLLTQSDISTLTETLSYLEIQQVMPT